MWKEQDCYENGCTCYFEKDYISKHSEISIQDKVEKWNRDRVLVTHNALWKNYSVLKRIRKNVLSVSVRVYLDPTREKEALEIKNVLVYVWWV